jgi:fumarate reductase flavoprotein subunit
MTWDKDIIVIGGGGAGLAAAITAGEGGARVLVLEKMPALGGNTIISTAGMNAAGSRFQKSLGIEDDPEIHFADTMAGGYHLNNPDLVRVMATEGAAAVEWMAALGLVWDGVRIGGGASRPRAHYTPDRGLGFMRVLKQAAIAAGVEIMVNTKAKELKVNKAGRVTGVIAESQGKVLELNARAVILATGGFGANLSMVAGINPCLAGFASTNHPGATGDGIKIAQQLGAAVVDMEQIQTHPTVTASKGLLIGEGVRSVGGILINREGKRFVEELETRDVVSQAILNQPGGTAFLLIDQKMREFLGIVDTYVRRGMFATAASIEELAGYLAIPAAELAVTVNKYNGFVAAGHDPDFGRRSLEAFLKTPPYYAAEVTPAVHYTMGGVTIDTRARVLQESGEPIPGLYAAGEVTGGVHGGNRLGGNAMTDIIVFGRIAGAEAAGLRE